MGLLVSRRIVVRKDAQALQGEAVQLFVDTARSAIKDHATFRIALSGGNTPRPVYEQLASEPACGQVDWSRVQVFFSDERFVPPDSPESNYRMANDALLSRVNIPARFVHPVSTVDISPEQSASIYEEGIRRVFVAELDRIPAFDLILLGMGEDGHTASLFPGTEGLKAQDQLVVANHVPQLDSWRLTFTFPLINAAHCVAFVVEGDAKADRVAEVLAGSDLPAARVDPTDGTVLWLLDEAAAARLSPEFRSAS